MQCGNAKNLKFQKLLRMTISSEVGWNIVTSIPSRISENLHRTRKYGKNRKNQDIAENKVDCIMLKNSDRNPFTNVMISIRNTIRL